LNPQRLKKLRPVECVSLRLKLTRAWRQLLRLADSGGNVEARQICRAASASAIFAGLIATDCCARR
jgi:hypothetical protein